VLFPDGSDKASAYSNRGLARAAQGDLAAAVADCDRAIELLPNGPDRAMAYNNRGRARHAQGDVAEAIADYDRAIELAPQLSAAYNNRATRPMPGHFGGSHRRL